MFRLRTFGGVLIEGPDGPLTGAASQRRRLAVLALLAAHGNGVSRDRLVAVFWPESDEEHARHALAQLLYGLRRELGAGAIAGDATILRLDPAVVSSDAHDFHEALARGDDARAADLHTAPFLDGFHLSGCPEFERWVEEERARLTQRARAALDRLATKAEREGRLEDAVTQRRRVVALDPFDARSTLALLHALVAAGDRSGALRQARIHEELLRTQLEAPPDPEVVAFAAQLQASRPPPAPVAANNSVKAARPPAAPGPPPAAALPQQTPSQGDVAPPRAGESRRRISHGIVKAAVAAAVVLPLVLWLAFRGSDPDVPPERIVIADVENETGESVFDRSVVFALAAGLAQSGSARAVPPERVRQALVRMRQPSPDVNVDETLAREIARREGFRFVLVPAVRRAEEGYVLSARLLDPTTGAVLGLMRERAARREDVIDALDALSRRIRRAAGESRLRIATRSAPLPRVTTPSLEALEKFASGSRAFGIGLLREARLLWQEAVALDSTFAAAHAALGQYAYWTNSAREGEVQFARALAHMDGLPRREQTLIRATIESWRTNRNASIALLKALLVEDPSDLQVLKQLGYDYLRENRDELAVDIYRRIIRLDATDHTAFINLATVEKGLSEYDSAIAHYHQAFRLLPSLETENSNINHEYGSTWVLLGQPDSARATFSRMLTAGQPGRARGLRSLAFLAMAHGQYAEAATLLEEAVRWTVLAQAYTSEVRNRLLLATARAQQGRHNEANEQLAQAYAVARAHEVDFVLFYWLGKALSRSGDPDRADTLLTMLDAARHPDNVVARGSAAALRGEIMVARGEAVAALPHFERALHDDSSKITLEALAHATAAAGDLERATLLYEELAQPPSFGHESQELLRMASYWLGRIAEQRGYHEPATQAYERFLRAGLGSDPDLPALLDARDRLIRLRSR